MIKKLLNIILFFILIGCSDTTSDCLSTAGNEVTKTLKLSDFSKIIVHQGIRLELKQGIENSIHFTYGENFIDNITTSITDNVLSIENSTCNVFRNTTPATIVLTVINIDEIRNASEFKIISKDVLKFNSISLFSEDYYLKTINVGDFELIIDSEYLNIISNNVSNFILKGKTDNLFVGFYGGTGIFNGEELEAQNVAIFHRGINTMTVNPIEKISGEIRGVGDLISTNRPTLVDIQQFYTGKLIFK